MKYQNKFLLVAISLLCLSLTPSIASAVMIEGEMSISGVFKPTGGSTLADATGIDFMDAFGAYGTSAGAFTVGAVSGDFATYITVGGFFTPTIGYIQDIQFASFSAVTPLWQVGGFSFDLLSLAIEQQSADSLILHGSGEVYGNGYDRTVGLWTLTANGGQSTFSWSATTRIYEAPSVLLLGISLLALLTSGLRRKRN